MSHSLADIIKAVHRERGNCIITVRRGEVTGIYGETVHKQELVYGYNTGKVDEDIVKRLRINGITTRAEHDAHGKVCIGKFALSQTSDKYVCTRCGVGCSRELLKRA